MKLGISYNSLTCLYHEDYGIWMYYHMDDYGNWYEVDMLDLTVFLH